MKENSINHWLSFLTDVKIEEKESTYCKHLTLYLRQGRYLLSTPNAVYSFDDLYHNFKDSFEALKLQQQSIGRVLVLGMGMGSIPLLLERTFEAEASYTLVELDPAVIELAQAYSLPKLESDLTVVEADAYTFMRECQEQFDLIAVDIFIDDTVPEIFESADFLRAVKRCLSPNGRMLYNRLYHTPVTKKESQHFIDTTFKEVFQAGAVLSLQGNKMLSNKAF